MHRIEKACLRIRHHPWLEKADWLWRIVRPCYDQILLLVAKRGIERTMNDTESIRLLPRFRTKGEIDEPQVWKNLMADVRSEDIVVDVGAFIGLYTIALARRVGPRGRVIAFEPDPDNFAVLKAHVDLNCVTDMVELIQAAVGAQDGSVPFLTGGGSESHISHVSAEGIRVV